MKVRATRAYIAGFGTTGSLLAGAAVLFVLASAVVSFNGWPQVAGQSSAAPVVLTRVHASPAANVSVSRVAAVAAARTAAAQNYFRRHAAEYVFG